MVVDEHRAVEARQDQIVQIVAICRLGVIASALLGESARDRPDEDRLGRYVQVSDVVPVQNSQRPQQLPNPKTDSLLVDFGRFARHRLQQQVPKLAVSAADGLERNRKKRQALADSLQLRQMQAVMLGECLVNPLDAAHTLRLLQDEEVPQVSRMHCKQVLDQLLHFFDFLLVAPALRVFGEAVSLVLQIHFPPLPLLTASLVAVLHPLQ